MKYAIVEGPPENVNDYVTVPPNDIREKFVDSLNLLLRQRTFHIKTEPVQSDWADEAIQKAQVDCYAISVQAVPVNLEYQAGKSFWIFYFNRVPNLKPSSS